MSKLFSSIKSYLRELDGWLILLGLALTVIGFVIIYSTTHSNGNRFIIIQMVSFLIGLCFMVIISKIDYSYFIESFKIIFILCLIAIFITIMLGIGASTTGQSNWIRFLGIGVQLPELVKIGFIITFAAHLDRVKENQNSLKNVGFLILHVGIIVGALLIQGDTGIALVFLFIAIVMAFVSGIRLKYFLIAVGVFVAVTPLLWIYVLKSYQKMRILVTFNPELDPQGFGYQVLRSKIAIGSGEIFGKGLFHSTQNQYGLLPNSHTDFIFSIVGEEFGLVGCTLVIVLSLSFILRLIFISQNAKDDAGSYILIGIAATFTFQALENIGMCIGLFPVVGLTLPFISYGGTSLVTCWCLIGLALSVYINRRSLHF